MDEQEPFPEPLSEAKPPSNPGMHGGLQFVLLSIPGFIVGCGGIALILQFMSQGPGSDRGMTMAFSLGAFAFFFGAVALGGSKRWGLSGLLMGMTGPFVCCALIAAICGK